MQKSRFAMTKRILLFQSLIQLYPGNFKIIGMKKYFTSSSLTISLLLYATITSSAAVHHVPADFPTIQSAINGSSNGDTVIVAAGVYYENLNFKGKNIVLTSNFYLNSDTTYINQTIINGSQSSQADTGSCVIFSSGEDSLCVLMGFTITGGTGTAWLDAHGAGTYREGGGILIDFSSPTIRNNKIVYNVATNSTGLSGAGGGGIRISDANPKILNNYIAHNQGKYGPGVVLNWTGCIMRNNIICYNSGGDTFNGGGAIWSNTNSSSYPKIIENNTIFHNSATLGTGGCLAWGGTLTLRNNILWGNTSPDNSQIKTISGSVTATFSDIQGGYTGTGNTDVDPSFSDTLSFILNDGSPCIDAGDSASIYNDIEDPLNSGFAKFPSKGSLRNDMGAYGGQGTTFIPSAVVVTGYSMLSGNKFSLDVFPNPGPGFFSLKYVLTSRSFVNIELYDSYGRLVNNILNAKQSAGNYLYEVSMKLQPGIYFLQYTIDADQHYQMIAIQ